MNEPVEPINEDMNLGSGASPYSPPDAYKPPKVDDDVPYEEHHPFIQNLIDEHKVVSDKLTEFEETLAMMENGKVDREIDKRLQVFFEFFDDELRVHNSNEEKVFFPILSKMMNEDGTHSNGLDEFNSIDILEDEHSKFLQMAAVTFNLFALFSRIPDERSRVIVLDAAIAESRAFVELVRVHIFREETIVFSYAYRNFSDEDFLKL
jgi:hemerythrin-like domain-containing protein